MEGPSIYLLAQELQIFKNQKIYKIYGNAKFDKDPLVNQTIIDVFSFGKRLIIQLNDYVLQIHFLMFGSYRINIERENMPIRLAIITSKNALFFYNCAIKCIKETNLQKTLSLKLDILSEDWNINYIIKLIKANENEQIGDVLLKQEIFAGVGNIIKNEALFLSKVSPITIVDQITNKKLKEIALNTRLFSQKFLSLRQTFQLKKNLQIYRKKNCFICGSKIIRQKTGKKQRWSYWCPLCQA